MTSQRFLHMLIASIIWTPVLLCQSTDDQIRVNISEVKSPKNAPAVPSFLNGYRRTLSGQTMQYHSSHPDAESALLVRARTDVGHIAWETDTIPRNYPGDVCRFVWLAGLECGGFQNPMEVRSFELSVNGEHWFTFQNRKDSSARHWEVGSTNGAVLSFDATLTDRAGDLFGTMSLDVPRRLVASGKPLKLEVDGEDAGSSDWFMTFQYGFSFEPRVRIEPGLRKDPQGPSQLVRISLDNLHPARSIQVSYGGRDLVSDSLQVGSNIFLLPIKPVQRPKAIALLFSLNGKQIARRSVSLDPVIKRDIYLLSYSHNDIGYTDLQPNIERKQWGNIDEALRIIERTRDYPPDARYKWNMEVLWSLDGYLQDRPDAVRQKVIDEIRSGSIGLNALYANELTGLVNAVEMNHLTEYARSVKSKYQVDITTALVSDVPGFTWGMVPALAHAGVKYFSVSPNPGDRIGSTIEKLGDKPFYWTSQSGHERILTWVAGASYASFHEGDISKLGEEKIFKLLRKLDEADYPYEIVQLPYTIGGDNGPPDPKLSDFVKNWNALYESPHFIIATHNEMFREFERRYGATLPVYSGDFTPYWEDGAASSAYETKLNRQASDRLVQAEGAWAIRDPRKFPAGEFARAWRNVLLYDEHTWGAHNSISQPDLPFVKGQWEIKRGFAATADTMSRLLLQRGLGSQPSRSPDSSFLVTNTQSWVRTDLIILPAARSTAGDRVSDELGNPVPSQRLTTGELAVLVKDIPGFSVRRFHLKKGKALDPKSVWISLNTVQDNVIKVSVDPKCGALSALAWKKNSLNLIDLAKGSGLNEFFYVPGKDPNDALTLRNVKIRVGEEGGLISSLIIDAEAPGCNSFSYEVRLVGDLGRVDFINRIDKKAVRTKEGVHIGFPFSIPGGELRYDVAWGIVRPEVDQIPGSCKNFFSVQSWVDVSNAERGVTWSTPDAPLIEIGSITAEKPWMTAIRPAQNFYSYLMNNYWHTNYKADQEGMIEIRYSVRPHGRFDQAAAVKFGIEQRQPLIVSHDKIDSWPATPPFRIVSSDVVALSAKPVESTGSILLTLYNPTARPQSVELKAERKGMKFVVSNLACQRLSEVQGKIGIGSYGSLYLLVEE